MSIHEYPIEAPDMTGIKPGSPQERALHQQYVEQRRQLDSAEHERIVSGLGAVASEAGVIPPIVEQQIRHGATVETPTQPR